MARPKKLTPIEEKIKQIQEEAAMQIAELTKQLPWETRFKQVFDEYVLKNRYYLNEEMTGYLPDLTVLNAINGYLSESQLHIAFEESTFVTDNPNHSFNDYDSSYPTYIILNVSDSESNVLGYVKLYGHYSSYDGVEFDRWSFVTPKEITVRIFE